MEAVLVRTPGQNEHSGPVGNLVQAGTMHGSVVIHQPHKPAQWAAVITAIAVVSVVTLMAIPNAWLTQTLSGRPRAAATPPVATATSSAPSTSVTAAETAKALAPLDVTVMEIPPRKCKNGWVVPDTGMTAIPIPRTPDYRPANAVLGDGGLVVVSVQGRHGSAVALQFVRVEIVARHPAMKGVLLPMPCGSDGLPRYFTIDLSRPDPLPVSTVDPDRGGSAPPVSFPYDVSSTEIENLIFTAASPSEDVEWRLLVSWSSGGESGVLPIDNKGKPFRTTATTAAKMFCFAFEGGSYSHWVSPGSTKPKASC